MAACFAHASPMLFFVPAKNPFVKWNVRRKTALTAKGVIDYSPPRLRPPSIQRPAGPHVIGRQTAKESLMKNHLAMMIRETIDRYPDKPALR
jgi:hypothetical protein